MEHKVFFCQERAHVSKKGLVNVMGNKLNFGNYGKNITECLTGTLENVQFCSLYVDFYEIYRRNFVFFSEMIQADRVNFSNRF